MSVSHHPGSGVCVYVCVCARALALSIPTSVVRAHTSTHAAQTHTHRCRDIHGSTYQEEQDPALIALFDKRTDLHI